MINFLAAIFTVLYAVLTYALALFIGVHGPELIGYFAAGCFLFAVLALWRIYFAVNRRDFKRPTLVFFFSGLGIGLLLGCVLIASREPLVKIDIYRSEKEVAHTEVLNVTDETLFSQKGNPVGIRLRYSMRFPGSNYFYQSPALSPEKYLGVSIWADMRVSSQSLDPPMAGTGPWKYERGKLYTFIVDMIPYFLMQNADKTTFCILKPPPEYTQEFQKLTRHGEKVRYMIRVSGTNFSGLTANSYNPKLFYDGAVKEGAADCGEGGSGQN